MAGRQAVQGHRCVRQNRALHPEKLIIFLKRGIFLHVFSRPTNSTVSEDAGTEHRTVGTLALAARRYNPQSRQSETVFSSSRPNCDPPPPPPIPHLQASVFPPPCFRGRDKLACGRGGGGSHFGQGDRHCGTLGIYVLSALTTRLDP